MSILLIPLYFLYFVGALTLLAFIAGSSLWIIVGLLKLFKVKQKITYT